MADNSLDVSINLRDNFYAPLQKIESGVIRFVGAVSASLATISAIGFPIAASAEFQKELLNVQKTTNFTDAQLRSLGDTLVDLSRKVNISAADLAKVAAVAGQLGLGKQGPAAIAAFADTASRFSSVMDVTVQEASTGLAKIANIFGISLDEAERISASFNELSQNSTASGSELLDIVQRLGNLGGNANLSEALGLAATGKDLGLTSETVGTSFVKMFSSMQAEANKFAKVMNTTTGEWSARVKGDAVGAFNAVLDRLSQMNEAARAAQIVDLFGGGRIFSLATKVIDDRSQILHRNIATAAQAYSEGTSSIDEQTTVLKGLDAQMDITKNKATATAMSIGDRFLPAITGVVVAFGQWVSKPETVRGLQNIADTVASVASGALGLATALMPSTTAIASLVNAGMAYAGIRLASHFTGTATSLFGLSGDATKATGAFTKLAEKAATVAVGMRRIGEAGTLNVLKNLATGAMSSMSGAGISKGGLAETIFGQEALDAVSSGYEAKLRSRLKSIADTTKTALAPVKEASKALASASDSKALADAATAEAKRAEAEAAAIAAQKAGASASASKYKEDYKATITAISANRELLQTKAQQAILAVDAKYAGQINTAIRSGSGDAEIEAIDKRGTKAVGTSVTYWEKRIAAEEAGWAKQRNRTKAEYTSYEAEVEALEQRLRTAMARAQAAREAALSANQTRASSLGIGVNDLANSAAVKGAEDKLKDTVASGMDVTRSAKFSAAIAKVTTQIEAAMTAAAATIGRAMGKIFSIYMFVEMAKAVTDMLGITDKIVAGFYKVTDALHITSAAAREYAANSAITADAVRKEREEATKAVLEYEALRKTRGAFSAEKVSKDIQSGSMDKAMTGYASAMTNMIMSRRAADAEKLMKNDAKDIKGLEESVKSLEEKYKKLEALKKTIDANPGAEFPIGGNAPILEGYQKTKDMLDDARASLASLRAAENKGKGTAGSVAADMEQQTKLMASFPKATYEAVKATETYYIAMRKLDALKQRQAAEPTETGRSMFDAQIARAQRAVEAAKEAQTQLLKAQSINDRPVLSKITGGLKNEESAKTFAAQLEYLAKTTTKINDTDQAIKKAFTGSAVPDFTKSLQKTALEVAYLENKVSVFELAAKTASEAAAAAMNKYKESIAKAREELAQLAQFQKDIEMKLGNRQENKYFSSISANGAKVEEERIAMLTSSYKTMYESIRNNSRLSADEQNRQIDELNASFEEAKRGIADTPMRGGDAESALKIERDYMKAIRDTGQALANVQALQQRNTEKPGSVDPQEIDRATRSLENYKGILKQVIDSSAQDQNFAIPDAAIQQAMKMYETVIKDGNSASTQLQKSAADTLKSQADDLASQYSSISQMLEEKRKEIKDTLAAMGAAIDVTALVDSVRKAYADIKALNTELSDGAALKGLGELDLSKVKLPNATEVDAGMKAIMSEIESGGGFKKEVTVALNFTQGDTLGLAAKIEGIRQTAGQMLDGITFNPTPNIGADTKNKVQVQLDAVKGLTVVVDVVPGDMSRLKQLTGSIPGAKGYATGGRVAGPGTGTSDSILAWLSNDEHVIDATTSGFFGHDFFYALKSIARGRASGLSSVLSAMGKYGLPAFANGGAVSAAGRTNPMMDIASMLTGGASVAADTVNVNFNIGGKEIPLQGKRSAVRTLVNTLAEMSRGT